MPRYPVLGPALILGGACTLLLSAPAPPSSQLRARDFDPPYHERQDPTPTTDPDPGGTDRDLEFLFEMKGTSAVGRVSNPGAMAAGPDGSIYVADSQDHRIIRFGPDGEVLATWGSLGSAEGQFVLPIDVAVGPDRSVYVSDAGNYRVQRFSPDGQLISSWGRLGDGDGDFTQRWGWYVQLGPESITVGPDGRVFVDDPGADRVQVFNADGAYLDTWSYGVTGFEASGVTLMEMAADPDGSLLLLIRARFGARQEVELLRRVDARGAVIDEWQIQEDLEHPTDLAVSRDGLVYVINNRREPSVVVFSSSGVKLGAWGSTRVPEQQQLLRPDSIAVSPSGDVFVGDQHRQSIQRYGADGRYRLRWGDGPAGPLQNWPHALSIGADGSFYVAQHADDGSQILRFNHHGEHLHAWGAATSAPADFDRVAAMAVGPSGRIYASDGSNHRIHVFEPDGIEISAWGEEGRSIGKLFYPDQLAITPNEDVLVYEKIDDRIQRFSAEGESRGLWIPVSEFLDDLKVWPGDGQQPAEVLSIESGCLVRRSLDATSLSRWIAYPVRFLDCSGSNQASRGASLDSIPLGPYSVDRLLDGTYVVGTDSGLLRMDSRGNIKQDTGDWGIRTGEFLAAADVAVMPAHVGPDAPIPPGAVIISDVENSRLQVFGQHRPLWRVETFDNPWLAGYPAHITTTRQLDLRWSPSGLGLRMPSEQFSARIDRKLPISGTRRVQIEASGGIRLWIDDTLLVDRWEDSDVLVATYVERPPGNYDVRLEFRGRAPEGRVRLGLEEGVISTPTPTPTRQAVPPSPTPSRDALYLPHVKS